MHPVGTSAYVNLSPDLLSVYESVVRGLDRVEHRFDQQLRSHLPPVQKLVEHIEAYRGKMLRPQLVCLCGIAASSEPVSTPERLDALITPAHVTIGAVCEMIHMATLVHDDVLDEADIRRKGATVNRLRGNETAVILGDYLFSSAYHLCSTLDSQAAALLIGACGMTLCTGELLQLHHRENFSIDQETYFEIVRRKTGSLIAAACKLGALASGCNASQAEKFHDFGLRLGVAFQIQDDLLDLTGDQSVVGKPLHRDAELGKLTLPIIHHLTSAMPEQRGQTLRLLSGTAHHESSAADFAELTQALTITGSLEHAGACARTLVHQAKTDLAGLQNSPAKDLLMVLADQVVSRAS